MAAIVGHPPLLAYLAIADGECQAREKFEVIEVSRSVLLGVLSLIHIRMLCRVSQSKGSPRRTQDIILDLILHVADSQRMLQPCGKPPAKTDD